MSHRRASAWTRWSNDGTREGVLAGGALREGPAPGAAGRGRRATTRGSGVRERCAPTAGARRRGRAAGAHGEIVWPCGLGSVAAHPAHCRAALPPGTDPPVRRAWPVWKATTAATLRVSKLDRRPTLSTTITSFVGCAGRRIAGLCARCSESLRADGGGGEAAPRLLRSKGGPRTTPPSSSTHQAAPGARRCRPGWARSRSRRTWSRRLSFVGWTRARRGP